MTARLEQFFGSFLSTTCLLLLTKSRCLPHVKTATPEVTAAVHCTSFTVHKQIENSFRGKDRKTVPTLALVADVDDRSVLEIGPLA